MHMKLVPELLGSHCGGIIRPEYMKLYFMKHIPRLYKQGIMRLPVPFKAPSYTACR